MSAHSRYSPSGFIRWSRCPGSLNLTDSHPEIGRTSSAFAEEGTRAHEVAEEWLKTGQVPLSPFRKDLQSYIDHCESLRSNGEPHAIEYRAGIPGTECFGTADFVAVNGTTLHVVDLKFGAGVPVNVYDNAQLKIYALICIKNLKVPVETVRMTIVQPRCEHPDGPIRSHDMDASEIRAFEMEVLSAITASKSSDAPLNPGDHCRWCPVAGVCPGLKDRSLAVARAVFSEIEVVDSEKLGETLTLLPMLEGFIKQVRSLAYAEAVKGAEIPGWKLVEKRANRKWIESEQGLELILEDEFGISTVEMYEKKLKSPAQIEKMLPPSERKKLGGLVKTESTGATLVPVTDRRKAILLSDAKTVFGEVDATDEIEMEKE